MALPISRMTMTLQDYDFEKSALSIWGADITAGNQVAQVGLVVALRTAILDLVRGSQAASSIQLQAIQSAVTVTDADADREVKWLVRYHDATTGQKYNVEIGTAKLSLRTNNSEFLDLAGTEAAAFVTAFEAYAKSPADSGHAVVVDSIQSVGRRS